MNTHKSFLLLSAAVVSLITSCSGKAGSVPAGPSDSPSSRPKLIVGIVVDQMKPEFVSRYWDDFGAGGFRRLVSQGFSASNLHYNYVPTYTGPGHASVYTGTTPAYHGIVANDWYVRSTGKEQYCAYDSTASGVGSQSSAAKMSPVHLQSSTIGDELRVMSNFRSKVIGVAMKDRGAILPAGRMATAAYWYPGQNEDRWVTSGWYGMEALPSWVEEFNSRGLGEHFLSRGWSLFAPEGRYEESMDDNNPYESSFAGLNRPVFPYDLLSLRERNGNFDLIKATPWGNSMTTAFAIAAMKGEQLGKRGVTDMLCLSYSSTDYIGHQFGIHSREIQDCYLRLDQDVSDLLRFLDEWVGEGEYLVFLTSDHGGAPTPGYLRKHGSSAQYFQGELLWSKVEDVLRGHYGEGRWLLNISNHHIFLNRALCEERKISLEEMQRRVAASILDLPGVAGSWTATDAQQGGLTGPVGSKVQLGYHPVLSGDVMYSLAPGWLQYRLTGTTHGSAYPYDTHVPAIFYGFGVTPGETWKPHTICDIAPTVSALCNLPFPNAMIGQPIDALVK
jgi:hypothetical protein